MSTAGAHGRLDVVLDGDVGAPEHGLTARGLALGHGRGAALFVEVGDHHPGPPAGEQAGRSPPQARSSAGDQRNPALEVPRRVGHGRILPFSARPGTPIRRLVAKTAERKVREDPSAKDVGRQLRQVRRKQGLSRAEVARSAGLTRRELAAYERGRVHIPESDLWCLAGSCGVEVGELLPHRDELRIDSSLASLAIGDSIRHLRAPAEPDGLLREYLAMIYELRNLPPGSRIPLRETDLATLADALGGDPETIEMRLMELIGASHEEAARLRAMILPPLAIAGPALAGDPPSAPDDLAAAIEGTGPDAVDDFFAASRGDDPFVVPLAGSTAATQARSPGDPLASLPIDPFAIPAEAPSVDDGYDTALARRTPPAEARPVRAARRPHRDVRGDRRCRRTTSPPHSSPPTSPASTRPRSHSTRDRRPATTRSHRSSPSATPGRSRRSPDRVPTSDESTERVFVPIAWHAPVLVPDAAAPLASDDATVVTAGAGHTIGVQVGDDFLTVHVDGEVVVKVDRQLAPEG